MKIIGLALILAVAGMISVAAEATPTATPEAAVIATADAAATPVPADAIATPDATASASPGAGAKWRNRVGGAPVPSLYANPAGHAYGARALGECASKPTGERGQCVKDAVQQARGQYQEQQAALVQKAKALGKTITALQNERQANLKQMRDNHEKLANAMVTARKAWGQLTAEEKAGIQQALGENATEANWKGMRAKAAKLALRAWYGRHVALIEDLEARGLPADVVTEARTFLETQKTAWEAATTVDGKKAVLKATKDGWQPIADKIKAFLQGQVVEKAGYLQTVLANLEEKVAELKTQGKDVTALESQAADAEAKLAKVSADEWQSAGLGQIVSRLMQLRNGIVKASGGVVASATATPTVEASATATATATATLQATATPTAEATATPSTEAPPTAAA